tara:strand:+ start:1001 stop:1249 length:249 start_codon:yes stop_codon:yes gene_type:complete
MTHYIVGTHKNCTRKGAPQVYWSKNRRAFVPRGEAQDAWDACWTSEASAKAYARRHGIPTNHVRTDTYSVRDMDVTAHPFAE